MRIFESSSFASLRQMTTVYFLFLPLMNGVSFEDLEFVDLGLANLDGGIFVIECFIDLDEWVRTMSLLGAFF